MKDRTKLNLSVGLFAAAGIASLLMLAYKVGNLGSYNAPATYQLQAYFSDIGLIQKNAAIRSSGVLIGHVTTIAMDPDRYQARISMSIDSRYRFPRDTYANIRTDGVLGEQYIALAPGVETRMFKGGEEITKTQSAMVLENTISKIMYNKAASDD